MQEVGGGRLCRKVAMKRFLRWMRPVGARVLRFDSGFAAEGCGIALRAMRFICRLTAAGKPLQPRLRRVGNAPLLSPAATSPPEGEILATLYFELLVRVKAERRVNFPLRGKWCAAPKGVHFYRPSGRFACFLPGEARLYGFLSVTAINSNCHHCPASIVPPAKRGGKRTQFVEER